MTKEINATDDDLASLMMELEEQNNIVMASRAVSAPPVEPPAPAPAPVVKTPVAQQPWEDDPSVGAEVPAPPVVVDRTRAAMIHDAKGKSVFPGTVADLDNPDYVEVEKADAIRLLKEYKSAKVAAKLAEEAEAAKKAESKAVVESKPVEPAPVPAPVAKAPPPTAPEPTPAPVVKQAPVAPPEPEVEPVSASLKHYVDVPQFLADTKVSDVDLDKCMIEQNSLRSYYGVQAAQAEAQAARHKARFEVVEATLYDHHRKALASDPSLKTTEKMVDSAVKMDPRWLKAKNIVIEAETLASINKSLVDSLRDRKDMIVQLGADRREEGKGAVRTMMVEQERQDLRERALQAGRRAA